MHGNGPCLVLAGPGSGKTYVLTHHIYHLINSMGVSPENILVITFTKEAKKEMKSRYITLDCINGERVTFGTFHAVFFALLRQYFDKNVQIINDETKKRYLAKISGTESGMDTLANEISEYKSGIIEKNGFISAAQKKTFEIMEEYNELLASRNELDYDDILLRCYEMLKDNPALADKIGNRFKYILIDEFQDINEVQYNVVKAISRAPYNIFAVGDDDQAIYAFRGADKEIMKRFTKDYESVKITELLSNYRSHRDIVKAASLVIGDNTGRMKSGRQECNDNEGGEHFCLNICAGKEDEYAMLKKLVLECVQAGMSVAVLTRTNSNAQLFRNMFDEDSFEKESKAGLLFEASRDIRSYYDFCKKETRTGLLSILNRPDRYIESSIIKSDFESLDELIAKVKNIRIKNELSILKRHIEMLKRCTPKAFCLYFFNVMGYKKYFIANYRGNVKENEAVLSQLVGIASESESMECFVQKLPNENKKQREMHYNGISFMTFHASKGLEFDAVFIPDVLEGNIPGRNADMEAGIEEERRLFYVAMTRARKKLCLLTIKNEGSGKYLPSRFIRKLL